MDTPRLATLTATMLLLGGQLFGADKAFRTDFENARAHAAATGRPLLIHFYADYCAPCRRMEAEVFSDADLNRQLSKLVVAVKVNTAHRQDLAREYGVNRIPHDRIIAPNGTVLNQGGGFMSKWAYLAMVRTAGDRFAAQQPKVVVQPKKVIPPVAPKQPVKSASPKVPTDLVNLDGYCPVELGRNRKWVKGVAGFRVEHKGLVYRISSKANFDLFNKNPEKYAPQVLGCDPVVLAASQRAVAGRTDFGAFFDGKLYLFQTNESRTTFKQNPLKYIRIQHALDASKIERTVIR